MSDHEDRYIEWVAEHRSGFLGGLADEGFEHLHKVGALEPEPPQKEPEPKGRRPPKKKR